MGCGRTISANSAVRKLPGSMQAQCDPSCHPQKMCEPHHLIPLLSPSTVIPTLRCPSCLSSVSPPVLQARNKSCAIITPELCQAEKEKARRPSRRNSPSLPPSPVSLPAPSCSGCLPATGLAALFSAGFQHPGTSFAKKLLRPPTKLHSGEEKALETP